MVTNACILGTWETEAGESRVQGEPRTEFKVSLVHET